MIRDLMIGGAPIEALLSLWATALRDTKERIRPLFTPGLLVRRSIADGERASFTTWAPQGTPVETLVRVEGARWRVEEGLETTKTELGLDHNESRSWHGWHRHFSLVMLAYAVMTAVRSKANAIPPKKTNRGRRQASSAGLSRKSAASP